MNRAQNLPVPATPSVSRLQSIMNDSYGMSRGLVGRCLGAFGPRWAADFESLLENLFIEPGTMEAAIKGYSAFAMDSIRRQRAFEQTRAYPSKSYDEAAQEVYFNERHMKEEYLPGLLLSHYLWPHHYRQLQFFDTAFLDPMHLEGAESFAEIGVGTGVYSRRLLEALPQAIGTGYDISPASCAFALRQMALAGLEARFSMKIQNILEDAMEPVSRIVCVEVLEHLEDPVQFLKALRKALLPGGRAFITAAVNAAHSDHIYLYRTGDDVRSHLEAAGFALDQCLHAAAYAPPAPGVPVPLAAAFVVY